MMAKGRAYVRDNYIAVKQTECFKKILRLINQK
jgi:hypothetical protein